MAVASRRPALVFTPPRANGKLKTPGLPRHEVDVLPAETQNGADPQLAKAAEVIMNDLRK
jgi:tricorn protease